MANYVARIPMRPPKREAEGHLTSPAVSIKQAKSIRSQPTPAARRLGARLRLALWTRPLDWREPPDHKSEPVTLTGEWQRCQFTFAVDYHVHEAVVDLAVTADGVVRFGWMRCNWRRGLGPPRLRPGVQWKCRYSAKRSAGRRHNST